MNSKGKTWRIEYLRKHIRYRKIRYSIILVVALLIIAVALSVYAAASNKTTLEMLYKTMHYDSVVDFDSLTHKEYIAETLRFLQYGMLGKILNVALIVLAVLIVYSVLTPTKPMRRILDKQYRKHLVMPLLEKQFENVEYSHEQGHIQGVYNGISFEQSNVVVNDEHSEFEGRLLTLTVHSGVAKELWIAVKGTATCEPVVADTSGHRIYMEDVEFDDKYDVIADSSEDAHAVLTPVVMEKLIVLADNYRRLAFRISEDKLYVSYATERKAFQPDLAKPIKYNNEMVELKKDIRFILDIFEVDEMLT